MKAKPIIDLDIIIDNDSNLEKIIPKLKELGYRQLGNMGIMGREAFKRLNLATPILGSKKKWFKHNLYLCEKGSVGLSNHIYLRNYIKESKNLLINALTT